jgi:hypothetical protein
MGDDADTTVAPRSGGMLDQPVWVWAVIAGVALLVVGALVAVLLRQTTHRSDAA